MTELYGWTGEILRVDLTDNKIETEKTAKHVPEYIGGKGIATRIAWEELKPGVKPYDPENLLMFMTGPFSGTLAPTSGRGIVCSVSPRTYPIPWFTYSGMGGNWAAELKYAGFDGIVFKGNSDTPVYLWIHDGEVEVKSAEKLWGLDIFETQELLKTEYGKEAQIICIGPGGENLVVSATIHHRQKNSSGMPGFGAVMGAKKLKAIVIRGTGGVRIAKPVDFVKACREVRELVNSGPTETPVKVVLGPTHLPCTHACPFGCSRKFKDIPLNLGDGKTRRNIPVMCNTEAYELGWGWYKYPTPLMEKDYTGDIYTRAIVGLGRDPGAKLQVLIEALGLSGWTYLTLRCLFLACLDNHVTEINGYKLAPDNPKFWEDFFKKLAYREGIGNIFADGLMQACDQLDLPPIIKKIANWLEPMWGFPSHRDGRGAESQPSPLWIFDMLHWVVDSRDPLAAHHQTGYIHCWFPPHFEGGSANTDFEKLKATFDKMFGAEGILEPGFEHLDEKIKVTIWLNNRSMLKDSLLLCDWCFPRVLKGFNTVDELTAAEDYCGNLDAEAEMLAPLTGLDITTADLDKAGERIRNLDRALHIRNYNRSREIDASGEWVFEYPEKSDGTKLDKAMFDRILDIYYENRGWDKKTGWPTRAKLEELGLKDVAEELDSMGKLP